MKFSEYPLTYCPSAAAQLLSPLTAIVGEGQPLLKAKVGARVGTIGAKVGAIGGRAGAIGTTDGAAAPSSLTTIVKTRVGAYPDAKCPDANLLGEQSSRSDPGR